MDRFDLRTISERGLLLVKIVFAFQDAIDRAVLKDQGKREKAAKLLEEMAETIRRIEDEFRAKEPNVEPQLAKMRIYLAAFRAIFDPLMGQGPSKLIYIRLAELFLNDDGVSPLIEGFMELKRLGAESGMERHNNAAFATLTLAAEKLESIAIVIEFPEAFEK